MRTMGDSTTQADIPGSLDLAGGYPSIWTPADFEAARARFKRVVRIARSAAENDGDVLDVETGDATPDQAPGWVARRRAATGRQKGVYCGWKNGAWDQVIQAFRAAGVPEPTYWVAEWESGDPTIPPGAVAKQWQGSKQTGAHYDLSSVADFWPGIDEESDMGLRIEPPFEAVYHETGAHWAANSDGSSDQGPASGIGDGTHVSIVEVSADGSHVRPDLGAAGSSWWLPSSTVGVILGAGAGAVPPHTHPVSVTVSGGGSGTTGQPA